MPGFRIAVPHQLQREVVVERLRGFADRVRHESPVSLTEVVESWDPEGNLSFSFRAMGFKVSGSVITSSTEVHVSGNLPWTAVLMRGEIENQIAEKIRQVIG
jgi:hypothetical protein